MYHNREVSSAPPLQLSSIYRVMFRTLLKLTRLTGYSAMSMWCVESLGGMVVIVSVGGRSEAIEKSMSSRLWNLRVLTVDFSYKGEVHFDGLWSGGIMRSTEENGFKFDLAGKTIVRIGLEGNFVRDGYNHLFICIAFKDLQESSARSHVAGS